MSINSSSSPNVPLIPPPTLFSIFANSSSSFYQECIKLTASVVLYSMYTFTNALLLPLNIFVLCVGYRRWRQQTTTHSDIFTYIIIVEFFGVLGSLFLTLAIYTDDVMLQMLGVLVTSVIFPGRTLFHCLTCLELYVAVVSPVVYMRLRDTGGVRIRNVGVGSVWLLSYGWIGLTKAYGAYLPVTPLLCLFVFALILQTFCSLSVLFALTHAGPGEPGGDKERVAQSKRRSFSIMMSITGVLLLRCFGVLSTFGLCHLGSITLEVLCPLTDFGLFLTIPSSLVLPLLFLHKTGHLGGCGHCTGSD